MAIDLKKFVLGGIKLEPPAKPGVCRVDMPDGGFMEIRTGGNIDLGDGTDIKFASANYKLGEFEENYHGYFSGKKSKPDPSSEAK
ncbi:MAG TPA: hypothetical protein VMD02_03050 [Candidatus Omnitrophota bacterium]|nr:hypothetical protein [Candidatus Omnitrophota bacterium]